MYSLIGNHFIKRFFDSRFHRRRVNPDSEALTLLTDETNKPDEAGYTAAANPLDTDATLENRSLLRINQFTVPDNGSDQPTTDKFPF